MGGSTFAPLSPKRSALGGNRNNWRVDSIEPVWGSIPGEGRSERMRRLKENSAAAAAQAASRNLKSTSANSQAATQASATASKNARAENGNGDGKETVSPEGST